MKVLLINTVCGVGSTGRICTDIAECLTNAGHECKIAYGRDPVPEQYKKYAVRIGNDLDVKVHGFITRIFDRHGLGSYKATKKFIQWVREYDPDVIHLHNIHGYYINIKVLFDYLKDCGKKIVWTLHDCWAITGHCTHFENIGCEKWKYQNCVCCRQKKEYPKSILFSNSRNNYKIKKEMFTSVMDMTIVTPSQWLSKIIERSFLSCYPIEVIPNGVDFSIFKPTVSDFRRKYHLEEKKILLGVANVWTEQKGLKDFVELCKKIDDRYKIVLVGINDNQKKILPKQILTIEKTTNMMELASIYTCADVFINPSYQETMGMTTVEAMACGTPVIVYNLTALPELVDLTSGIVVEPHVNEIINSLDDAVKLKKNNEMCIKRAQLYKKEEQYRIYLELYEK